MTAHRLINWSIAGLIALGMSSAYLLDGSPTELEAARDAATARDDGISRALAAQRMERLAQQACGENASWQLRQDGAVQCLTKRGHKTSVVAVR
jgi:hypothetical protein